MNTSPSLSGDGEEESSAEMSKEVSCFTIVIIFCVHCMSGQVSHHDVTFGYKKKTCYM